jgi:hypothetical protein
LHRYEWCSDHYAVTGNIRGVYASGFDDNPQYISGNAVELSSSPTFDELVDEQVRGPA